jgi:hypothetical protein
MAVLHKKKSWPEAGNAVNRIFFLAKGLLFIQGTVQNFKTKLKKS